MVPIENKGHLEFDNFLTDDECKFINDILLRDEHKILRIPNNDNGGGYTGTTNKYSVYNLLDHGDIRPLNIPDRIFALPMFTPTKENWYSELWVQCWCNVLHQQENLPYHCHVDPDLSDAMCAMSVFIEGHDPSYTTWEDKGQTKTVCGTLHVVGQHHHHEVRTNIHRQPRISIAMDVYWNAPEVDLISDIHNRKRFKHIHRPTWKSTDHIGRHKALAAKDTEKDHGVL